MLGMTVATLGINQSVSTLRQAQLRRRLMLQQCFPQTRVAVETRRAASGLVPVSPALVCGMPGAPPCDTGTPQAGLSGLSGWSNLLPGMTVASAVACDEFAASVKRLGIALAEAKRIGVTGASIANAQLFYDNETSWAPWKRTDPVSSSSCTQAVATANGHLEAVNALVKAAGGQSVNLPAPVPLPSASSDKPGGFSDVLATVRMVALGGAVIAGVVLLAPVVWEAVAGVKALRKAR